MTCSDLGRQLNLEDSCYAQFPSFESKPDLSLAGKLPAEAAYTVVGAKRPTGKSPAAEVAIYRRLSEPAR